MCFTFYWRQRLPIDVLFQHHPIFCNFVWACKPHHIIIFLLLVFIGFIFYLLWFQNSCANLKELLWLFVSLTNFSPYHLLNFFQQSLIILKYGSVYEISRIFINYYVRRSYDLVFQGKLCIKNVFQLLACKYQLQIL